MKLYRTIELEKDACRVGDIIAFSLKDGEAVEALAVKQEQDGMVFCSADCLHDCFPMSKRNAACGDYDESHLRRILNGAILRRFPDEIREKMVAFRNGDLLRIPTKNEIGCKNIFDTMPDDNLGQWEPMKKSRNYIAFCEHGSICQAGYWLKDKHDNGDGRVARFSYVNVEGYLSEAFAFCSLSVRLVFKLSL